MGLSELFSDVVSSLGFAEAQAEAPPAEETESNDNNNNGEVGEETDQKAAAAEGEEGGEEAPAEGEGEQEQEEQEEEEGEEEEEEEEEEEAEDIKPKLEADCANSSQCAPFKHHYDECVERVTRQQEESDSEGPKEDCVEEFFHLQHCAAQCAAPQLWKNLK